MSANPFTLQTADALFARPECVHIITMNNPGQNLHLERAATGFLFTAGLLGGERHGSRVYTSLDDLYNDEVLTSADVRGAVWQDITAFPPFSYGTLYLLLDGQVELQIPPNSEERTTHGPYVIYGPAEIARFDAESHSYRINATDGWLVIEHPACTMSGGAHGVLRPTRNVLDRLRLRYENYRLHRKETPPVVLPGVTVVYGKPPADWQAVYQTLTAPSSSPVQ